MRKVKQKEDNRGLYRTRDAHSARLQEGDENIDVAKQLNVQQVKKLAVISKLERSTADQSPYDEKIAAFGQNHNESSFKVDEERLEILRLKDVVEKWKNKNRILNELFVTFRETSRQSGDHIPNSI